MLFKKKKEWRFEVGQTGNIWQRLLKLNFIVAWYNNSILEVWQRFSLSLNLCPPPPANRQENQGMAIPRVCFLFSSSLFSGLNLRLVHYCFCLASSNLSPYSPLQCFSTLAPFDICGFQLPDSDSLRIWRRIVGVEIPKSWSCQDWKTSVYLCHYSKCFWTEEKKWYLWDFGIICYTGYQMGLPCSD